MVFYDRYNDFLVFKSNSVALVLTLLYAVVDFNFSIDLHEDQ